MDKREHGLHVVLLKAAQELGCNDPNDLAFGCALCGEIREALAQNPNPSGLGDGGVVPVSEREDPVSTVSGPSGLAGLGPTQGNK